MRIKLIRAMALLLALPAFVSPAAGQAAVQGFDGDLTAGAMIARIRDANRRIVRNSGKEHHAIATAAVATLDSLVSRLDRELRDMAESPISELGEENEDAIAMGIAGLTLAEDAAATLESCLREDVSQALDALAANLDRTFGDTESWKTDAPRVLRVRGLDPAATRAIRVGPAQGIVLEGTQLHSDDCGPASARITTPGGDVMEASAVSHEGRVAVEMPPLGRAGLHEITIRVRRKKLLFFCRSASASVTIAVLPEAAFRVEYAVTPMREQIDEIVWNAGELRLSNERCDGDTIASSSFRLPDGWSYASHEWIVFLNTGAEKVREDVRGNEVHVEYRVPRRGALCLGPERLIHGKMEIRGTRTTIVAGPSAGGPIARTLGFGESMSIPMRMDSVAGSSIVEYSVEVRLTDPDGKVHVMSGTGAGTLQDDDPRGGSYVWDPEKARLRISAPPRECGGE